MGSEFLSNPIIKAMYIQAQRLKGFRGYVNNKIHLGALKFTYIASMHSTRAVFFPLLIHLRRSAEKSTRNGGEGEGM